MKARIEAERLPAGEDPDFHLKLGRGSLTDIEFTVQLLALAHDVRSPATLTALDRLEGIGAVDAADADALRTAYEFCERTRNRLYLLGRDGDALPQDALGPDPLGPLPRAPPPPACATTTAGSPVGPGPWSSDGSTGWSLSRLPPRASPRRPPVRRLHAGHPGRLWGRRRRAAAAATTSAPPPRTTARTAPTSPTVRGHRGREPGAGGHRRGRGLRHRGQQPRRGRRRLRPEPAGRRPPQPGLGRTAASTAARCRTRTPCTPSSTAWCGSPTTDVDDDTLETLGRPRRRQRPPAGQRVPRSGLHHSC